MDLRELKALEIAARSRITLENGVWSVPSQTSPATRYRVTLCPVSCTCEDFQLRQQPCKHVIAARLVCERDHGQQAPAIITDAVPVRPTYKQNWPAYPLLIDPKVVSVLSPLSPRYSGGRGGRTFAAFRSIGDQWNHRPRTSLKSTPRRQATWKCGGGD
jgi:hypothetical protein